MKIINSIEKPFRQAKIEVLEEGVYWNTTFDFEIYINTFIKWELVNFYNDNPSNRLRLRKKD